jgi:glutamyl-Q tRNA(Asp) synthetase
MIARTRFAPSPTGYLHIGHGFAAQAVQHFARRYNAKIALRIEDIDATRCRPEFTQAMVEDLRWIGFEWDDLLMQSQRLDHYAAALAKLEQMGLAYRCFCSRKEIASLSRTMGPEGPIYPGTCRHIDPDMAKERAQKDDHGWRLDHAKAVAWVYDNTQDDGAQANSVEPLHWRDISGTATHVNPAILGDILLAGRDRPASYHLAVVVDDARPDAPDKAITHIIRGHDLLHATHVHRLLQAVLGYPAPVYAHHALLITPDGRKLAKSDNSLTLRSLREGGMSSEAMIADLEKHRFPAGILCDDA